MLTFHDVCGYDRNMNKVKISLTVATVVICAIIFGFFSFVGNMFNDDSVIALSKSEIAEAPIESAPADISVNESAPVEAPVEDVPLPVNDETEQYFTVLDTLAVQTVNNRDDYDRVANFGKSWFDVDQNGCKTRDDILNRDLTNKVFRNQCSIDTGYFVDIYTGIPVNFQYGEKTSGEAPIDHIYSLKAAWNNGAANWDQTTRMAFANDPDNLTVTTRDVNSWKSDKNPAEMTAKPYTGFIGCEYAKRFITITAKYSLTIASGDKDALVGYLNTCK